MIFDRIENIEKYKGICESVDAVIEYFAKHPFEQIPTGKIEILSDIAHGNRFQGDLHECAKWESHKRDIDMHLYFGLNQERIDFIPSQALSGWEPYEENIDCNFTEDHTEGMSVYMKPGDFALLFPWEAHKPMMGSGRVDKAVIKLKW